MAWRIEVAPSARPTLAAMDPSLRGELIEQAAFIAEDVLAHVRRASAGDIAGAFVHEYDSRVLHNTRVQLLFSGLTLDEQRIVLVGVKTIGTAE